MATSGTVGQTVISTAKLLEHAWRRCGLVPSTQTPEQVQAALESLYFLITYLASRGINLWTVTSLYISLEAGRRTYVLPPGVRSILNAIHHRPTILEGTATVNGATSYTLELDDEELVTHLSLILDTAPNGDLVLESSEDGITWSTFKTIPLAEAPLELTWYSLDPTPQATFFRVTDTGAIPALSVGDLNLTSGTSEVVMSPLNRDQYAQQPNKSSNQSDSVTSYFFERLLDPQITCWPVPNSGDNFLNIWVHRDVEDVGLLSQELAVPSRWFEAFITHWALRIALENPSVPDAKVSLLKSLADEMTLTSELDETDNSPIIINPGIRIYTR